MAVSCFFYLVHPVNLCGFIVCLGEAEAVNLTTKGLNVLTCIHFTVQYHSMHFYTKLSKEVTLPILFFLNDILSLALKSQILAFVLICINL